MPAEQPLSPASLRQTPSQLQPVVALPPPAADRRQERIAEFEQPQESTSLALNPIPTIDNVNLQPILANRVNWFLFQTCLSIIAELLDRSFHHGQVTKLLLQCLCPTPS